jgi:hypothetical protein
MKPHSSLRKYDIVILVIKAQSLTWKIVPLSSLMINIFFPVLFQTYSGSWPPFPELRDHTQTHRTRKDFSEWVIISSHRPLPSNSQHSQGTNIHAFGGIRTHNPSKRAAAVPRLRPRGHWDRQLTYYTYNNILHAFHLIVRLLPKHIRLKIPVCFLWRCDNWPVTLRK